VNNILWVVEDRKGSRHAIAR